VQRGYLGAVIRQVDGNFATENDLSVNEGVYVENLTEDGAAAKAGVKKGDVIRNIDGMPIHTSAELLETIGRHRPGDKITLTVLRENKTLDIPVTLKNQMGNTDVVEKGAGGTILNSLGADFENLDKATAKKLGIEGGVLVENLRNGKLTNQTDVREGFIITKVDGQTVTSVDEFAKALEGKSGGVMLEGVYEDLRGVYYYAFGL
jgi:S1-C subfamily serine protease